MLRSIRRAQIAKRPTKGKQTTDEQERAEMYPDLLSPHRFVSLEKVKISFVASGTASFIARSHFV